MWMLAWVPDSYLLLAVHAVLVAGAVSTFLSFFLLHRIVRWFPMLAPWHLLLQIISIALLVGGVYFKGGYDTEASWRAKVKEAEDKVALVEEQARTASAKIETKVVTQTKVIREKGQNIIQYVDRVVTQDKEVVKFVENCPIPTAIVNTLNAAAKNQPIEEKK